MEEMTEEQNNKKNSKVTITLPTRAIRNCIVCRSYIGNYR